MSLSWPDHAETIDYFIGNEIRVIAFHHAMVKIVVTAAVLHIRSERRRQVFRLVLPDEIHHVVGNQRREPAHAFARHGQIIRNPNRSRCHHFDLARIAARGARAFFHESQAPGN